jgi:tetratricopeptide (TPR) repeat protein
LVLGLSALGSGSDPQEKTVEVTSPLSTARAELKRGNISAAEKIVWDALSSNPNEESALTLLGTIRERQKRYAEAEALFRRSIQLNAKSIEANKHLASVLVLEDKDAEAADQYREALVLVPQDVHVKMELARLYMGQRKCSEALSLIGAIPAAELPSEVIPPKAFCLTALGHSSEAAALIAQTQILGTLNRALSRNPNSVPTLLAISQVYAAQHKHKQSLAALQRARSIDPGSLSVLRGLIVEDMEARQGRLALQFANELQEKGTGLDDKYLIAAVMLQEKKYDVAAQLLEEYVAKRPQDGKAALGLGIAYLAEGKYVDARKWLEHSLELDPNLLEAHYELGMLARKEGKTSEGIQRFATVLQKQPENPKALLGIGTLFLEEGQFEKAEAALRRSQRADASEPETEYQLSLLFTRMGKQQEAQQHMTRFRQLKQARDNELTPRDQSKPM